ncbi:MAG: leucyl aminopeptidase [Janthinobacterium lividum]
MLEIDYDLPALPAGGALAFLVAEGEEAAGLRAEADAATGGALTRAAAAAEFRGRAGQSCVLLAPGAGLTRVVLVGLGPKGEQTRRGLEEAGGTAVAALARDTVAALAADGLSALDAAAAAQGARLRLWRFDRYRTREKPEDRPRLERLTVLAADPAAATEADASMRAVAEGVFVTRELVSEPGNILTPPEFARRIEALRELGLLVEVHGQEELERLGFGAMLAVSQGSAQPPRMVVMRWKGTDADSTDKPVAFIGKGVTFDTGGISIKGAAGMEDMKWDMAGAGTVVGLMAALAGRRAKVDAVGVVGLVENMPSGTAYRPGDVVRSASGQTVEVLNTDAEGRMVLADVLWWTAKTYEPRFMVDLATLTGAMVVALGHEHAGLFSNDDALAAALLAAGTDTGERLWRMPLHESYDRLIRSDIADMKQIGGRPGGGITAAQFLARFVGSTKWAHLDIAGTAWSSKDAPCVPKGATAFGVRLLDRLVAEHYEG